MTVPVEVVLLALALALYAIACAIDDSSRGDE